jgi:phosphomannomutase
VTDLEEIGALMARLRANLPSTIGGVAVESVDDFATGVDGFAPNDILRFRLGDGSRVIVRPSGTEPKLKAYLDASSTDGTAAERLRSAASTVENLEIAMRSLLERG